MAGGVDGDAVDAAEGPSGRSGAAVLAAGAPSGDQGAFGAELGDEGVGGITDVDVAVRGAGGVVVDGDIDRFPESAGGRSEVPATQPEVQAFTPAPPTLAPKERMKEAPEEAPEEENSSTRWLPASAT